ncbi:MAG: hypothetical protein HKM95_05845 [Inquilinus sp.]|nr:hypothetical protein [Inquilinus sp.]
MADADRDYEAVFAELRDTFRDRLPDMARELNTALELCGRPAAQPVEVSTALERLQCTAHSLAGQGGTFGYPEISVAAADLEDYVVDLINKGSALSDAALAGLREAIGSLLRITANC